MRFLLIILLSLNTLNISAVPPHKFYVSTTILEENVLTGSLELTVKVFVDDLEEALLQSVNKHYYIGEDGQSEDAGEAVRTYVLDHLSIAFNDKSYTLQFIGFEVEADLCYCYFEILPAPGFRVITIRNTIFHELFEEQVNIVHLRFSGWTQRLMLDKRMPEQTVNR